jgi:uroporphyrin-III C-methyltransferase/precorrin-2 dehydrogenase/sirohydrochlorin ferrochelatase
VTVSRLARFAEVFRDQVRRTLDEPRKQRVFWDQIFEGRAGELALAGDEIGARRELIRQLDGARAAPVAAMGMVHLVGAGPGDPELLTLKAHRLLQTADIVVHDRLIPPEVLAMARRDAERLYVGNRRPHHGVPQEEINDRLISLARAGKSVVRLKSGDPFIFGRGGEEIDALLRAGVPVEVVPGVTAALGCAASTGVPLTHPDHAQACVFVTGHLKNGQLDLDWTMLARPRQTVVIYMGAAALPVIASQLVAHGLPASTPVALVENGTTDRERRVVGTLATIERQAAQAHFDDPTLCIVGAVVGASLARSPEFRFESRMGLW